MNCLVYEGGGGPSHFDIFFPSKSEAEAMPTHSIHASRLGSGGEEVEEARIRRRHDFLNKEKGY